MRLTHSQVPEPLQEALQATGYLLGVDDPAPGLSFVGSTIPPRTRNLIPDAWWRSETTRGNPDIDDSSNPTVLFKYSESINGQIADWQQDAWNLGFTPLLWVVTPDVIRVYNGYGKPQTPVDENKNLLKTFAQDSAGLSNLDSYAGRLAMETGKFWQSAPDVTRETGVFKQLMEHLVTIETLLVDDGLQRLEAQALICRSIFTKYLIDRHIVSADRLKMVCGQDTLPEALDDPHSTKALFEWLRITFNGDMFPEDLPVPEPQYLQRIASFLRAESPEGQLSLFPYRFDVIPVKLISSIYERFVHSFDRQGDEPVVRITPQKKDAHYTPLTAVTLILDEVFDGLTGCETVIDPTCGSGIFLVEALRRLVRLKTHGQQPTRETIRKTLNDQIYGIDISPSAVQITAFSLYLAALELDPDPTNSDALHFSPLVDKTILIGDVHDIAVKKSEERRLKGNDELWKFDIIIGNPPWSYTGRPGTVARQQLAPSAPRAPRGVSLDYINLAQTSFAHSKTRYGVLVNASHFFSSSTTGLKATQSMVESLGLVTLVDLSGLRHWLFSKAKMPAMAVLTSNQSDMVGSVELVRLHRSPEGDRSHDIGASPRKVIRLPIDSWKKKPELFKTALIGGDHDLLLLNSLNKRFTSLKHSLKLLGEAKWASGLVVGRDPDNKVPSLLGLPQAGKNSICPFSLSDDLPDFQGIATRPRNRDIYRAPLVLVPQYLYQSDIPIISGRLTAAVGKQDLVYTNALYGVSLHKASLDIAYLLAGIINSSLSSWYTLMTAFPFGIEKNSTLLGDVKRLPTPDLMRACKSDVGRRITGLVRRFHEKQPSTDQEWLDLDNAVFDLYELDAEERIVAHDGRLRASWEWNAGRCAADMSATQDQIHEYAEAFLLHIDAWFYADNKQSFRSEIFDTGSESPLKVIRFSLEDFPPPSRTQVITGMSLDEVLGSIENRLNISIVREIVGAKELIVHSRNEVVIVKPSAQRFWLGVAGLNDARSVLMKSFKVQRG
ncbi:MAG: N-6 DNA methylase [Bacteroidetes bacterium]|nr:N-6 DNA methylase [Bacteroidota bacterium]